MAKNITLKLSASNLGPHESLKTQLQIGSIGIGIYANNGSGKTFLSRAFRLATKKEYNPTDSNKLLTLQQSKGDFKLDISNLKEPGRNRIYDFKLIRNSEPLVRNNTGYIFRVFNDDYIKENLEVSKYRPNGEIEGYILGKEKIDLSKEKDELKSLKAKKTSTKEEIKVHINSALTELNKLSIRKNTSEYQSIHLNNILLNEYTPIEEESFSKLLIKHNQLKSIPVDLKDIFPIDLIKPSNTLNQIISFLKEPFTKSKIAEEFKLKVKHKQEFIENGINLIDPDGNTCPFCEQTLQNSALKLIDQYVEYLNETEAKQIKKANDLFAQLRSERKDFSTLFKTGLKRISEFNKSKIYIPSIENDSLLEFKDLSELDKDYQLIKILLDEKKEDISKTIKTSELQSSVQSIENWIIDSNTSIEKNNTILKSFNKKKNNINSERLELNRRLCKSKFLEIKKDNSERIESIKGLSVTIDKLFKNIAEKEQNEKVSKKEKVIESFKDLLTKFFGDKYSFDEQTFCIKFQNELLESNASDVLSTGEKSMIAFCYFIAETHIEVSSENDYQKLFFVVDDPISSQDFHFVYATAQIIRTLDKIFKIDKRKLRLILMTHNLEFMSIITRNNIISQKYILANGRIKSLSNELIMPYEEHLRDIYNVANGIIKPSHTTPNSLRHIIETINRFTSPDKELADFCNEIDGYAENEFLFSLMHDGSHGGIRQQKAYTESMIKSASKVVINYVETNFKGQIKLIEK
ncbi:hypothetical protein BST92_12330 [Nonlabens arenilitoris]|uniref:Protein CR006 P-loop domain-containing protein n=1 Tax=Nonlabens arenilitoris TaxID=1217969 RepID=A0A2S7UDF7_9FLAO|nr:AAA family ATPase [Nonlabens arenilitoris]PQJ32667.1 hypothetical protein BST92_12330 [Nonlabens arenilitoris]